MKRSLAFWLWAGLAFAQSRYDLLLRGGHVIDPKNGIDAVMDVAVKDGRIAAAGRNLSPAEAAKTIDVSGLYVTPGLVDIHTHLFATTGIRNAWAGDNSVLPDGFSFRTGVTTMVDAGSSGWRNFETFRHTVIDRVQTRVFALINIAGLGMITDVTEQEPSDMQPDEVARMARKHRDVVVGVKSAHYQKPDWTSVDRAVEAGRLAGIPVMVDFGYFLPERPYYELVTKHLRPGDISTHMFRGPVPWVDAHGKLYGYLQQARERGVKFDVGHGGQSFVLRNAVPAIEQGFYPDSISTDLHVTSMNGAMMDMPTTMSKLMAMGLPLREAILRSTWNPAQMIAHPELGHLSVGAVGDVAVWRLMSGDFGFRDNDGGRISGKQRLLCEMTLKDGRVAWDWNSLGASDYRKLPPDYGVRPGIDRIVRPPQ
jgi:dihydroorotase